MNKNNTFVFDLEWSEVLKEYPPEIRLEVYEAIIEYASSGTLHRELKPIANMAFSFIKRQMDYNRQRYEATVEERRKAGRSSAQKRAQQKETKSTNAEFAEQNQQPSTNSTDNVIVYDIDNIISFSLAGAYDARVKEAFLSLFFAKPIELNQRLKKWNTTAEELRQECEMILDNWSAAKVKHLTTDEAKKHFVDAVDHRMRKIKQDKNYQHENNQTDRFSARRGTEPTTAERKGFKGTF